MSKTWRQISAECIAEAYQEIRTAQPDLEPAQILQIISRDHYPFGERECYPYKAWLLAIKDYKVSLGLIQGKTKHGEPIETPLFEAIK